MIFLLSSSSRGHRDYDYDDVMAMTSLLLLRGHRHRAGEEADVLPAEGACFGGLCDFEGAGGADADVAAGGELGLGSVVVADEARRLVIIIIILV